MKSTQQGFTLIELVMVIVILGILAATAIPRFVDLSNDADLAALRGVQGSLSSASAINYATRAARGSVASGGSGFQVTTGGCTNTVAGSLLNDGLPGGYIVGGATTYTDTNGDGSVGFGDTLACTITKGTLTPLSWTLHYAD